MSRVRGSAVGPLGYPVRKLSLTFRLGLSRLGSTKTTDCQVPSCMRPSITGMVIDGAMKAGKT